MSSIFRLRPANSTTLEEIENSYLWFSFPRGFNDVADSNVVAFINKNENIESALNRLFVDEDLVKRVMDNGISCFTKTLPELDKWRKYPKPNDGICIEFDKRIIHDYFTSYGLGDCFKTVEYLKDPSIFKSSTYKKYDVLWETSCDGDELFLSLEGDILRSPQKMELLFLKMFTRLNIRHKNQNEIRIIIGENPRNNGVSSGKVKMFLNGFQFQIPKESIKNVFVHPNAKCNDYFMQKLQELVDESKIVYL